MNEPRSDTDRYPAVPSELSSPAAKLVYLRLAITGGSTIDRLATDLDLRKLTLYSVLRTLESRRLLETEGDRYRLRNP